MQDFLPILTVPLVILFVTSLFIIVNKTSKKNSQRKIKKNNHRWCDLDSKISKLDEKRKLIDGEFYKELKYVVIKTNLCYLSIEDRSLVRFATRLAHKKHWGAEVYSSDTIIGKLVFNRAHAKRYISSFWYSSDV